MRVCKVEGCDRKHSAKGYCKKHYNQIERFGETRPDYVPMKCKVDGCDKKHHAKGYCGKHYKQTERHGHVLQRTIYTPNEIEIFENYAEIIIYTEQGIEKARSKIDLCDVGRAASLKWHFSCRYVLSKPNRESILLHRFLLNPHKDLIVDHRDGDTLNNRRNNLRIATKSQNNMHRTKLGINNTSGKTGVSFDTWSGKWIPFIYVNKKCRYLGRFNNLEDAIEVRLKAEKEIYGEFAPKEGV